MLEQFSRTIAVTLAVCFLLPGCSSFSKTSRQQAAYARYVRKYSHNRVKQTRKYKKVKMPATPVSNNAITAGAVNSPQSVTASGESSN